MRERLNEISILDLNSFLIMPVQRVPRYVLLLDAILKYTPHSHPEYPSLLQALDSIKAVATYVNEGKRHAENVSKLVDVQDRVSGSGVPQLVEPFRRFIREGIMNRISVGLLSSTLREKKSVFFLFSDLLLWAGVDHSYKGVIWLVSASVDTKAKERRELSISSAKSHLCIRFDSDEECRQWTEDIERMIGELQEERNRTRVLYRDLKSRRRQNGDNTPTPTPSNHASGATTPIVSVDGHPSAAGLTGSGSHQDKDSVHTLIAEKLRELQLRKDTTEGATDEPSLSSYRRPSSHHNHNLSLDVGDMSTPQSSMSGGVGGLERRMWRGTGTGIGEEISVRGMASARHNVCTCSDREEGRRNTASMAGGVSTGACPIHKLPTA